MASLAVLAPSPLFRSGLAALLSSMGFDPVEEAADLEELRRRVNDSRRPDLLLISLHQRDDEIVTLIDEITAWAPNARVVFLAPTLDMHSLSSCFAAGAAGYLLESISRDGLQYSLRLVSAGEKVFASELAARLSAATSEMAGPRSTSDELRNLQLTERQVDILRCVANGESNSLIGRKLNISEADVRAQVKHIVRSLRLANRTQLALWGAARGLAAPFAALTQLAENIEGEKTEAALKNSASSQQN